MIKDGGKWPVVTAEFQISEIVSQELIKIDIQFEKLKVIRCTNYYDDPVEIEYVDFTLLGFEIKEIMSILDKILDIITNIDVNKISSIKLKERDEESGIEEIWSKPDEMLSEFKEKIAVLVDACRNAIDEQSEPDIKGLFSKLLIDVQGISAEPWKNEAIGEIQISLNPIINSLSIKQKNKKAKELIWNTIPIFVYFDDYSMLETKIYIPEAVQKIQSTNLSLKVRSQWALMEIAGFPLQEIAQLAFAHADPEAEITEAQKSKYFKKYKKER